MYLFMIKNSHALTKSVFDYEETNMNTYPYMNILE